MKSQLLSYLDFQNLVIRKDVLRYLEDLKNDPAYEALATDLYIHYYDVNERHEELLQWIDYGLDNYKKWAPDSRDLQDAEMSKYLFHKFRYLKYHNAPAADILHLISRNMHNILLLMNSSILS